MSKKSKGRTLLGSCALLLAGCAGDVAIDRATVVDGFDGAAGSGGGGPASRGTGGRGAAGSFGVGGAGAGGLSSGGAVNDGGGKTAGGMPGSGGAVGTGGRASSGGARNSGGGNGRDASIADAASPDSSSDGAAIRDGATDGNDVCEGGAPLPFGVGKKRLFETRARFKGNLVAAANAEGGSVTNGLAAGDELCNHTAAAAGLGGTWIAWLSDSATNAIDRIQDVGPWYRLDGAQVFANKAALVGNPRVETFVTEDCTVSDLAVWTGTLSNGTKAADTCDDWRSSGSDVHGLCGFANTTTNLKWSEGTAPLCFTAYNLYCFEQ